MSSATDIVRAAGMGNIELVEMLLMKYPSQINIRHSGHTALHAAARAGNVDVMKTLMHHDPKPDLDFPDSKDCTPLHYAVNGNQPAAVLLLIKAGASLGEKDEDGQTPSDVAFNKKIKECVKIFIDMGVKFKSKSSLDHYVPPMSNQENAKTDESEIKIVADVKPEDLCIYCKENKKFVKFEPCGCIISCFECSFINAACMKCGHPIDKCSYTETPEPVNLIKQIKFMKDESDRMNQLHICRICEDVPINCVLHCGHMLCIKCVIKMPDKTTRRPHQLWICPFCKKSSRFIKLHADWLHRSSQWESV